MKRVRIRSAAAGIRWIKYEEKVDSGDHWSKPHVSTLPLHAITTLRSSIADSSCVVYLDLPVDDDTTAADVAGTESVTLFLKFMHGWYCDRPVFLPRDAYATHTHSALYTSWPGVCCLSVCLSVETAELVRQPNPISGLDVVLEYKVFLMLIIDV